MTAPDTFRPPEVAISVEGLSKRFGERLVVDNLTMSVRRGQIYGFLGPNGSGKTTTIRMLCGLLTPDAGQGTCLGLDIRTQSREIRKHVGYMTQKFSLYTDLSVRENLEFVARLYGVPAPEDAAQEAIRRLGLEGRGKQLAGELSGGWKQRLALGACILPQPQLLVSTHYMDEAERCHEIAYIAYGHLLAQGTVAEVIASSGLVTYVVEATREAPDPAAAIAAIGKALAADPAVEMVAPFGVSLHVSGHDAAALEAAITPHRAREGIVWRRETATLEDVFIDLMLRSRDNME